MNNFTIILKHFSFIQIKISYENTKINAQLENTKFVFLSRCRKTVFRVKNLMMIRFWHLNFIFSLTYTMVDVPLPDSPFQWFFQTCLKLLGVGKKRVPFCKFWYIDIYPRASWFSCCLVLHYSRCVWSCPKQRTSKEIP